MHGGSAKPGSITYGVRDIPPPVGTIIDVDWRRLNLRAAGNGLFAEGLATVFSGVVGALPQTASPGSVGLSIATGVTSRYLGFAVGALLILLSFFFADCHIFGDYAQAGDWCHFDGGNCLYLSGGDAGLHFPHVGFSEDVCVGTGAFIWHGRGNSAGN